MGKLTLSHHLRVLSKASSPVGSVCVLVLALILEVLVNSVLKEPVTHLGPEGSELEAALWCSYLSGIALLCPISSLPDGDSTDVKAVSRVSTA